MAKLNTEDLVVETFATGGGGGGPVMLPNTDPRACPATQGWDECTNYTYAPGCYTGGCAAC